MFQGAAKCRTKAAAMQVAMARIPPHRRSGKTPRVIISSTASVAILTGIEAMGCPFLARLAA
jgi:hypothetical protein